MTFFKLFYTTDTQNTRPTHRTPLENKNINTRKKITEKTRKKHTPAGGQRKTTRKKTQNAIFEKRDVLFKLTRLCFLHHGRQDGGNKILILFYIYFGFGTLVFGYRKTPPAENKKYVRENLKYVRCISKYVRPIFRGLKPRVYGTFGAEDFA